MFSRNCISFDISVIRLGSFGCLDYGALITMKLRLNLSKASKGYELHHSLENIFNIDILSGFKLLYNFCQIKFGLIKLKLKVSKGFKLR